MIRRRKEEKDQDKKNVTKESVVSALRIFRYIEPYKWYLISSLVLVLLSTITFFGLFKVMGVIIDVAQGQSEYDLTLKDVGLIMVFILVVQGLASYLRVILTAIASENGIADLRTDLYKKLITLPITFFEENKTGDLISRISSDAGKLFSVFSITLVEFFRQIITLVVGLIFLFVEAPKLSVIMLLSFPIVVLLAMFFGRRIRKLSKERQKQLAESNSHLGETLQNIQVVKSFASEEFENKKYVNSISEVVSIAIRYAKSRAWFSFFIMTVFFGAICFIIFMGARMLQSNNMTAGELLSFISYTSLIGGAIAGLGNFTTELFGAVGATERIMDILHLQPELSIDESPSNDKSLKGNIEFKNVEFRYPSRKDIVVLHDLNMSIRSGEKVALVGPSGAGKSTIFQLLLRFYKIDQGQINLDNRGIDDYDMRSYRSDIAIVPQEVTLFSGSIRENILYGDQNATEDQIIKAAELSNCLEFINDFPEQMDTLIGERGVKLSGGQRQRIAIARAILKNPTILLLDEATSALDSKSEVVVRDALEKLMEGRTTLIIAHRLSTITNVDTIYLLEDGKIVEKGSHDSLMSLQGKYYQQAKLGRLFSDNQLMTST